MPTTHIYTSIWINVIMVKLRCLTERHYHSCQIFVTQFSIRHLRDIPAIILMFPQLKWESPCVINIHSLSCSSINKERFDFETYCTSIHFDKKHSCWKLHICTEIQDFKHTSIHVDVLNAELNLILTGDVLPGGQEHSLLHGPVFSEKDVHWHHRGKVKHINTVLDGNL